MYTELHSTQLIQVLIDEVLYDSELNMRHNYGNFMGNGKFYEIGTSLAETAFMANGIYSKRVDTSYLTIRTFWNKPYLQITSVFIP